MEKDTRFVHPQEEDISPIVSEVYYWLGVNLHHLRTYESGLVAGDDTTIHVKTQALRQQVEVWSGLLKFAHEATYNEQPTTHIELTRRIPFWAKDDLNAEMATRGGLYVIYRDAAENKDCTTGCTPWRPVFNIARWGGENESDEHVAQVDTIDQARAVLAAQTAPRAEAHVLTWYGV